VSAVVLLHPDRVKRERLAKALRARGLPVLDAVSVEEGLDVSEGVPVRYVVVETSILLTETYAIETRFSLRNVGGTAVQVVALTHVAAAKEVADFQKHGAILLPQGPENVDMLALVLGASPEALVPNAPTVESSLLNPPPERLESDAGAGPTAAPTKADGEAPLVLIIDDDEFIRELVEDMLAAVGYRTHTVASAMAAVRYLQREGGVDIMVSDINMPVFDGYELKDMLDVARSVTEAGLRIPFVVITGEDTPEKYALAIRLGASGFVPKPIKSVKGFRRLIRASWERALDDAQKNR
jgi:CheY-like chemotaxis protein